MILTEVQKKAIEIEFSEWTELQYAGKSKKERQKLAQFFTPPPLTFKMLEKFDTLKDKDILDPTVGAGGLLVACILAGADPKRVYGIELDPDIADICRKRLAKYGVPANHIKVGNALDSDAYNFEENPTETSSDKDAVFLELIKPDDNSLTVQIDVLRFPDESRKHLSLKLIESKALVQDNLKSFHKLITRFQNANYWICSEHSVEKLENAVNKIFKVSKIPQITFSQKLKIKKNQIAKIAAKQKFNSFDDLKKLNIV